MDAVWRPFCPTVAGLDQPKRLAALREKSGLMPAPPISP